MMKASPSSIAPVNSLMTAAVQAGKAPMCSGSTTCWAMISPRVFISAQEASCDSRMMVEKPVRNSEFCISCTMPESEAFTTSRSIGSTVMDCHDLLVTIRFFHSSTRATWPGTSTVVQSNWSSTAGPATVRPTSSFSR